MGGLNAGARAAVRRMVEAAGRLGVQVRRLPCGATLVDAGVEAAGGIEAGLLMAEACLGGRARVDLVPWSSGTDLVLSGVQVWADRPHVPCMAAQYAGWAVRRDGYFALGSGPARLLARSEPLLERLGVEEESDEAVLVLEARRLPPDAVAAWIADRCGVSAERLWLVVAPTACPAGTVQVAARVVETGLHKMAELGFDVRRVLSGWGISPLAPVGNDDAEAMGRTNDCILYGGVAQYRVDASDAELAELAPRVPSGASADFGLPFSELLRRAGGDFYRLDPLLFGPAAVALTSSRSGRTFRAGRVRPDILGVSLWGDAPGPGGGSP